METLIDQLNKIFTLPSRAEALIMDSFESQEFTQGEVLIRPDRVARHLYFLSSGFVKGFRLEGGKVVVEHLVLSGEFFTSLDSFMNKRPTRDTFQAEEDCVVYKLDKEAFDQLNAALPAFRILSDQIMNRSITCKMERIYDFQTLSAKARYMKLIEQHPMLVQHASVQDLASYLGVEPSSLSRIRKEIAF